MGKHGQAAPYPVRGWTAMRRNGQWDVFEEWPAGLSWVCSHITRRGSERCVRRRRVATSGGVKRQPVSFRVDRNTTD